MHVPFVPEQVTDKPEKTVYVIRNDSNWFICCFRSNC
ncbi:hypothetical protein ACFOJG_08035 [Staphylococcus saprophyticus]